MPSYLIVANRTLASPELASAIEQRMTDEAARFRIVVPATPTRSLGTWDEDESREAAQERLDALLRSVRALGAEATGEIGAPDPVDAVADALRSWPADEVIVSTLPPGISRWLGSEVPDRIADVARLPVVVVSQAEVSVRR